MSQRNPSNEPHVMDDQALGKLRFLRTFRLTMVIFVIGSIYGVVWSLWSVATGESEGDSSGMVISAARHLQQARWLGFLAATSGVLWWYMGRLRFRVLRALQS